MNKALKKAVLAIVFSLATLSANAATYNFTALYSQDGTWSQATGINNSGQIVGTSLSSDNYQNYATLWNGTVATYLDNSYSQRNKTTGINSSGQVIGGSRTANGSEFATLWIDGVAAQLGTLGGDYFSSQAKGINDSGQIVGWLQSADYNYHATLWNGTVATDLGALGGAFDINNSGQIVGVSGTSSDSPHATLWIDGVATQLGTLGGDFVSSEAKGINDSGQIVGVSRMADGWGQATLWIDGVATNLDSLLSSSTLSEGWNLTDASDINDNGSIVGSAHNFLGTYQQAFVLAPVPEADTSAMLLMGAGVMGFIARRRKQLAA